MEIVSYKDLLLEFDVYTGENVGENEKSLALKLTWTVSDTLTEDVINQKSICL